MASWQLVACLEATMWHLLAIFSPAALQTDFQGDLDLSQTDMFCLYVCIFTVTVYIHLFKRLHCIIY